MIERIIDLEKYLNNIDYNKLWKGFKKTNYAIYNDEKIYIKDDFGIDIELTKEGSFFVGNVDERFIGNAAIKINNEYIAIWSEDYISEDMDNKKLASLIIHEMFHCFQLQNNEKRFPNEIIGIDYPITVENISLRMLERKYLLDACMENDKMKKLELVSIFYSIRDKRENLIGKTIDYEKALESIEGIAVYVEFKSLVQLMQNNERLLLEQYLEGFAEIREEHLEIRQSTLSQGLLLSIIADEYIVGWKSEFFNNEEFLSDFIKRKLDIEEISIDNKDQDLSIIKRYINNWEEGKNLIFEEFNKDIRSHVLESDFRVTGFDPMNIVKKNNEMIHKNFLRIKTGEEDRVIKGPVKTIIGEDFFDVKRIEW